MTVNKSNMSTTEEISNLSDNSSNKISSKTSSGRKISISLTNHENKQNKVINLAKTSSISASSSSKIPLPVSNEKFISSASATSPENANYYAIPRIAITTSTNPPSPRPGYPMNNSKESSPKGGNSSLSPASSFRSSTHVASLREKLENVSLMLTSETVVPSVSTISVAAVARGTSISTIDDRDNLSQSTGVSVKSLVQFYSSKSVPSSPQTRAKSLTLEHGGHGGSSNLNYGIIGLQDRPNLPSAVRIQSIKTKKSTIEENNEISRKYIEQAKAKASEEARLYLEEKAAADARLQAFRKSMEEAKRNAVIINNSDAKSVLDELPSGEIRLAQEKNVTNNQSRKNSQSVPPNRKRTDTITSKASSRAQSVSSMTNAAYTGRSRTSSISSFTTEDAARLEKDRLAATVMIARERLAQERAEIRKQEQEKQRVLATKLAKEKSRAEARENARKANEKRVAIETARIERERRASSNGMDSLRSRGSSVAMRESDKRWEKIVQDRLVSSESSRIKNEKIIAEMNRMNNAPVMRQNTPVA